MFDAVVILGPTASGKSDLSLQLAKRYNCEIISLDSALIYKGMDIGTAKPSVEERSICPHHLIDICDPAQSYSAANFREDTMALIEQIKARKALPVICGGTMMYYKALVEGLSQVPSSTPQVRSQVQELADKHGWPYVHSLLKDIDTVQYERLAPNDKQRVARALEVYYLTGKPMSSFFTSPKEQCPFKLFELVLLPQDNDRSHLRVMIRKRFEKMLELGFLDEVKQLLERSDLTDDMPSMRSVGYRQAAMYLRNEVSYEEMIELSVIATARLAKHQMTWLRGGLKELSSQDKIVRHCLAIEDEHKCERMLDLIAAEPSFAAFKKWSNLKKRSIGLACKY